MSTVVARAVRVLGAAGPLENRDGDRLHHDHLEQQEWHDEPEVAEHVQGNRNTEVGGVDVAGGQCADHQIRRGSGEPRAGDGHVQDRDDDRGDRRDHEHPGEHLVQGGAGEGIEQQRRGGDVEDQPVEHQSASGPEDLRPGQDPAQGHEHDDHGEAVQHTCHGLAPRGGVEIGEGWLTERQSGLCLLIAGGTAPIGLLLP